MFGNIEEKQAEIKEKLKSITVTAEAGDGAVKITANAAREITNLKIDNAKIDLEDSEQLEDLVLIAMNRVLALATEKEAAETQKMLNDLMPPGFGGLSNLFG